MFCKHPPSIHEHGSLPSTGKTRLFISFIKPHKAITSSSIARWLRQTLESAGINTAIFGGHSTWEASASTTFKAGITVNNILKAANWKSKSVFQRFYHKELDRAAGISLKQEKGAEHHSISRTHPLFCCPTPLQYCSTLLFMLFFAVFWTKLVFNCFGLFVKAWKTLFINSSSLKYECPPPFEHLLAKTLGQHMAELSSLRIAQSQLQTTQLMCDTEPSEVMAKTTSVVASYSGLYQGDVEHINCPHPPSNWMRRNNRRPKEMAHVVLYIGTQKVVG